MRQDFIWIRQEFIHESALGLNHVGVPFRNAHETAKLTVRLTSEPGTLFTLSWVSTRSSCSLSLALASSRHRQASCALCFFRAETWSWLTRKSSSA